MSTGGKRAIVILGLILASSVISWGLSAIETRLAPIPSPVKGPEAMDAGIDALAASMMRWQLIYIPLLGLGAVLGAALLLDGRMAWLEAIAASLFVLALFVMIRSTTVSWASSFMWVAIYFVIAGVIAQLVRRWKTQKAT
jgi:hypothetical protein